MKKFLSTLIVVSSIIVLISCGKDDAPKPPTTVQQTKALRVNFVNGSPFTFFRFSDSAVLTAADSATNKWDFAMRRTTILVNSASSGPGSASASLIDAVYEAVATAPTTLGVDTSATQRCIKDGSWYDYNPVTRAFTPKAGKTFIFKTSQNSKYVKMEMVKVDYVPFSGQSPTEVIYTFRYTIQNDGSNKFY